MCIQKQRIKQRKMYGTLATLLPIQPPANVLWKAEDDDPRTRVLATYMKDLTGVLGSSLWSGAVLAVVS